MIGLLRERLTPYWRQILLVLALLFVQAITNLYLPTLNADLINNGIVKADTHYILVTGAFMLGVTLVLVIATIIAVYWGSKTAMAFGRDVRGALFRKVESFSQAELNHFGTPSLITRTTNDVQQVQMVVLMMLNLTLAAPIMAIGGIIMALRLDVPLSSVILVAVPVMGVFIGLVVTRALPLFRSMQKKIDRVNQVTREVLSGVRVIRAFDRVGYEEQRFDAANADLTGTTLKVTRLFALVMPALMLILNLATVAIIWFGSIQVADHGMPIGDLTAFLTYILLILMSVLMATFMLIMVPRASASAERIQQVLHADISVNDPETPVVDAPVRGHVEFRDVEFRYPGAQDPVLSHISFTSGPGEVTAIVGSTGSGKSTLINLIPRFYDVTGGSVVVDGVDVREMDAAGPVAQDRAGAAEGVPVQRHGGRQPALRRRGGLRRGALALPRDRPGHRLRERDARGARSAGRPGRRQRLGRAAPAPRHRPGARQEGQDPDLRRQLLGARLHDRRPAAGGPQEGDDRRDGDHRRPARRHRHARRPDHRARGRHHRRQGHARGAAEDERDLPRDRGVAARRGGRGMSSPQPSSAGKGPRSGQAPPPPPRQRGPGGGGPAGALARPTEKAKDFRGTLKRIVGMLRPERARIVIVLLLAVVSVTFAVLGPKILGNAVNILYEGVISKKLPAGVTQAQAVAGLRPRASRGWRRCCRPCIFTRVTASTSTPSDAPCCCSSASTC